MSVRTPAAGFKGRGALSNPDNRYAHHAVESVDDGWHAEPEPEQIATELIIDASRSVISRNDSPDIPFDQSINPYRGCEHGCVFCYARPTHAYLDLSPGIDFETRLLYKPNAAELLRAELGRPGYRCKFIMLGSNTDPYQPVERRLGITRSILEVLDETHHPVSITTRSALILRDVELLAAMARRGLASVQISITTFDNDLKRGMEPRSAASTARLQVIRELSAAGVPVGVMAAPMIPAINDSELETILERAAAAGAMRAAYTMLRLPLEVKDLFRQWLAQHLPDRAAHVMSLIQQMRGGQDNDSRFGARMRGQGAWAQLLADRFHLACRRLGLNDRREPDLDGSGFRAPRVTPQLELGL
ncbi:MAG: PA0069 family radical SAM protein [Nevskiaceae bacterium]|jgi:DNA repair photolyase|nr:PA0069 family radical SAM protein [Nevskiaceae bacterium]